MQPVMVEVGWHTGWNKVTTTLRDSEDTTRRHFCKWSALRPITDVGYVFDGISDSGPDPSGILSQKCKFLVRISDVRVLVIIDRQIDHESRNIANYRLNEEIIDNACTGSRKQSRMLITGKFDVHIVCVVKYFEVS